MTAATEHGSEQTRGILIIMDYNTRPRFLNDSGTKMNSIPPKPSDRLTPNPNFLLQAINLSIIKTYRQRLI